MTVPTSIPETPIVYTDHESFQGSKDTNTSISMVILQHVLRTVMGITNRILSKVQKSFWSCTHVKSCQKYTLYINLHILLNILCKAT